MSIEELPTELLAIMCSWFEQPQCFALRLTCKALYCKSLDAFYDHYYRTLSLLVTSESIQKLRDIAANESLRVKVKEFWVTPVLFDGVFHMTFWDFKASELGNIARTRYAWKTLPPPRYSWDHTQLKTRYAAYRAISVDHAKLLRSGFLNDTIQDCIVAFENIRSVGLRSYSTAYLLDADNGVRASGLPSIRNQLVCESKYPLRYHRNHRTGIEIINALVFSCLLKGVIASNRKLEHLHTCGDYHCGIASEGITLSEEQFRCLAPLIEDIESLHMCLCTTSQSPSNTPFKDVINLLMTAAPSLKFLAFSQFDTRAALEPYYFVELSESIRFSRLIELCLHYIEITPETFLAFLRTARTTLRVLNLAQSGSDRMPRKLSRLNYIIFLSE